MPARSHALGSARLALVFLVFTAVASAQPTPYVFSERVGPEIDAEERGYFGLFPTASGFTSARAYAAGDSVKVAVVREGEPGMNVTMTRGTAEALGRFIETFEQAETAFSNPNWQYVASFMRADVPVPYVDPKEDAVLEVDALRYSGVVLAVTDSLVLIQPGGVPYDWRLGNALAVRNAEIDRVEFRPEGAEQYRNTAALVGGGGAALVGVAGVVIASNDLGSSRAAFTVPLFAVLGYELTRKLWPRPAAAGSFGERRKLVEKRARFDASRRPYDLPDLDALKGQKAYASEPVVAPSRSSLFRRWYQRYGLVSVGFMGVASGAASPEQSFYTEFLRGVGEREQANLRNTLGATGGIDVSLRPVPWVRIGGTWVSREDTAVEEVGVEVVNIEPASIRGYAEVIAPLPSFGGVRVDLGAGLGMEKNGMTVERALAPGASQEGAYRLEQSWSTTFLQGTAEVFTSRRASFFLRVTRRSFSRSIAVEEIDIRLASLPGTTSYRLDDHDVLFEGFTEFMWGTRLHL